MSSLELSSIPSMSSSEMASNPFAPNYSFVFPFEANFDYRPRASWFHRNWTQAYYWIAAYLLIVFGGQQLMASRKAFNLRKTLVVWNLSLAVFSLLGTLRTIPELYHSLSNFGFAYSVCSNSYHTEVPVSSFWTFLFIVSKVPELGDTVFIVLRKQRLIFLHWYHHITVLLFTWYSYADEASAGRWYVGMNYVVHAMMYSYYTFRAMGIRVPKQIAMLITTSQIVQMILGTTVTVYALMAKKRHESCAISESTVYAGALMYFSYFVLFANFFINSYLKTQKKSKKSQ